MIVVAYLAGMEYIVFLIFFPMRKSERNELVQVLRICVTFLIDKVNSYCQLIIIHNHINQRLIKIACSWKISLKLLCAFLFCFSFLFLLLCWEHLAGSFCRSTEIVLFCLSHYFSFVSFIHTFYNTFEMLMRIYLSHIHRDHNLFRRWTK